MRELWLLEAVQCLRALFPRLYPVPEVRVSVGWATVRPGRTLGQCFFAGSTGDHIRQIFISPLIDDPVEVLDVLAHELVHAALPDGIGHDMRFVCLARRVGMTMGPAAMQSAGPALRARLEEISRELGKYPHVAMQRRAAGPLRQRRH